MSCETVGILNMLQPHMNACIGISQQSNSFMWTAFHLIPCRASKFFLFCWSWWWWLFSIRNNYPRLDLFSIISLMHIRCISWFSKSSLFLCLSTLCTNFFFPHLILWWLIIIMPFCPKNAESKKLIYDISILFSRISTDKKNLFVPKTFLSLMHLK